MNIKSNYYNKVSKLKVIISILFLSIIYGCASSPTSVMVTSATIIGVDVSQNTATQTPSATLGYKRAEFAYVPTNKELTNSKSVSTNKGLSENDTKSPSIAMDRHALKESGSGAEDSANVLMELRYSGIFSMGDESGIYQRLAVGNIAVKQQGASILFAKNAKGEIESNTANFLTQAKLDIINEKENLKTIITFLKKSDGKLDINKRNLLISKAKKSDPSTITDSVEAKLKSVNTLLELSNLMSDTLDSTISVIYKSIP